MLSTFDCRLPTFHGRRLCEPAGVVIAVGMRRLRFTSGLSIGLIFGLAAGIMIGVLLGAPRGTDDPLAHAAPQVADLVRQLEAAHDAKERADRQLEVFAKLADDMTATFKRLEERFTALADAERRRDQANQVAAPTATPAPRTEATPPPAPETPTAAAAPPGAPPAGNPG